MYFLVHESVIVIKTDLLILGYFSMMILIPTMWTLSCANSLNWETNTQKRLLSQRIVEMQYHETEAKKKGLHYWQNEIKQAKEMAIYTVGILNQDVYQIKVFGIRIDTYVVQVIGTCMLCLVYVLAVAVYNSPKIVWS